MDINVRRSKSNSEEHDVKENKSSLHHEERDGIQTSEENHFDNNNALEDVEVSASQKNVDSNEIPLELQCEVVDMENPDMDLLEWSVRKVIPIPKVYYWETGNEDLPFRTKAWHQTIAFLGRSLRLAERIGESVANLTGLNSSRFDYVTSTMTEEQWAAARATAEERKAARKEYDESLKNKNDKQQLARKIGVADEAL